MNVFRLVAATVGLSLSTSAVIAQEPQASSNPPKQEAIIEQMKKCVVFLSASYSLKNPIVINGTLQTRGELFGTGFLIFVPESRLGMDKGLSYLVTNKHMIREPGQDNALGPSPYFTSVRLKFREAQ